MPTCLKILSLVALVLTCCGVTLAADKPEGFGATSRGGRGGKPISVTTLADNGPGSLRAALAETGPRIVTFAVAGASCRSASSGHPATVA